MKKRLAIRLIEWRFRGDDAEAIVGDLSEEFDARAATEGSGAAQRWLWRQAMTSLVARRRAANIATPRPRVFAGISQDIRVGIRGLRRSPGFALTAAATLALGIGAASAVGTAASRTLLRPLPYAAGSRLVAVGSGSGDNVGNVGFETAVDWRARMTSLDQLALTRDWQPTLADPAGAVRLSGKRVSWSYFRLLGIRPAAGRDFEEAEDAPDQWRVVLLSDAFWRQRFGRSPAIIGSTITFNERPFVVAGVMPASFEPPMGEDVDLWAPLGYAVGGDSACRSCQHLKAIARLSAGATIDQARAELASVHAGMRREHPADYKADPPKIASLHAETVKALAQPMQMLTAAVAFVLLVACANVAGLLMARSADRTQEMALRAALGANRGRLIRQLLVESAVLAAAGTLFGTVLARVGLTALAHRAPAGLPPLDAAADSWLLGVSALVGALVLIACGLIPALLSSRVNLESSLRQARQTASKSALRTRESLMVIEMAAGLLVIFGGGLMYRTVDRLLHVDPGFSTNGVLTAGLSLVGPRWAEDSSVRAFQTELIERLKQQPGVDGVALAGQIPLGGNYDQRGFTVVGRPPANAADKPDAERYTVTPGYFDVMRIPLKQGRLINAADRFETEKVVDINETMAQQIFPGESPIGKQLQFGSAERPRVATIVGVVGDVRHFSLAEPARSQFYSPQEQQTDSYLVLVARGSQPDALAAVIRREVASLASDVPVYSVERLDSLASGSIATRSFLMLLLGVLGSITLVLAGVGLYGVVSQSVAARQRELGIRVALGATSAQVVTLVARRGAGVFAAGAGVGLAGAVAAGYFIQSQLYETRPADPVTLATSVGLLAVVAVLAHLAPVRRALRANPTATLRGD
jgi:predicted permease